MLLSSAGCDLYEIEDTVGVDGAKREAQSAPVEGGPRPSAKGEPIPSGGAVQVHNYALSDGYFWNRTFLVSATRRKTNRTFPRMLVLFATGYKFIGVK